MIFTAVILHLPHRERPAPPQLARQQLPRRLLLRRRRRPWPDHRALGQRRPNQRHLMLRQRGPIPRRRGNRPHPVRKLRLLGKVYLRRDVRALEPPLALARRKFLAAVEDPPVVEHDALAFLEFVLVQVVRRLNDALERRRRVFPLAEGRLVVGPSLAEGTLERRRPVGRAGVALDGLDDGRVPPRVVVAVSLVEEVGRVLG